MTTRVLTTVLFTDIVDSTARASELGDRRWRELLAAHHGRVRSMLRRYGGREVKTTGDGFLAVFDSAGARDRVQRLDSAAYSASNATMVEI